MMFLRVYHIFIQRSMFFHYFRYDPTSYVELKFHVAEEFPSNLRQLSQGKNMWIEVTSINADVIRNVFIYFDVHPFVIDDMRVLEQRMKITVLDEDIHLLINLIYLNEDNSVVEQQQMKMYLTENFLITIQDYRSQHLFKMIKQRLAKKPLQSKGRLKKMKIDYLFYSLLNAIIENYAAVLDSLLNEIERIDKKLLSSSKNPINAINIETLSLMFHIKHDLFHFKVVCAPLKDIIIKLQKTRENLVPKRQRPALRQCRRRLRRRLRIGLCPSRPSVIRSAGLTDKNNGEYLSDDGLLVFNDYIYKYFKRLLDHCVQFNDTIDSYTDIITSLIDFYMILNGDWINTTIQTLTLTSCLFMPLNFLSSLSSMNFEYMPQIPLRFGYYGHLMLMGTIACFMILLFRLKNLI